MPVSAATSAQRLLVAPPVGAGLGEPAGADQSGRRTGLGRLAQRVRRSRPPGTQSTARSIGAPMGRGGLGDRGVQPWSGSGAGVDQRTGPGTRPASGPSPRRACRVAARRRSRRCCGREQRRPGRCSARSAADQVGAGRTARRRSVRGRRPASSRPAISTAAQAVHAAGRVAPRARTGSSAACRRCADDQRRTQSGGRAPLEARVGGDPSSVSGAVDRHARPDAAGAGGHRRSGAVGPRRSSPAAIAADRRRRPARRGTACPGARPRAAARQPVDAVHERRVAPRELPARDAAGEEVEGELRGLERVVVAAEVLPPGQARPRRVLDLLDRGGGAPRSVQCARQVVAVRVEGRRPARPRPPWPSWCRSRRRSARCARRRPAAPTLPLCQRPACAGCGSWPSGSCSTSRVPVDLLGEQLLQVALVFSSLGPGRLRDVERVEPGPAPGVLVGLDDEGAHAGR